MKNKVLMIAIYIFFSKVIIIRGSLFYATVWLIHWLETATNAYPRPLIGNYRFFLPSILHAAIGASALAMSG